MEGTDEGRILCSVYVMDQGQHPQEFQNKIALGIFELLFQISFCKVRFFYCWWVVLIMEMLWASESYEKECKEEGESVWIVKCDT